MKPGLSLTSLKSSCLTCASATNEVRRTGRCVLCEKRDHGLRHPAEQRGREVHRDEAARNPVDRRGAAPLRPCRSSVRRRRFGTSLVDRVAAQRGGAAVGDRDSQLDAGEQAALVAFDGDRRRSTPHRRRDPAPRRCRCARSAASCTSSDRRDLGLSVPLVSCVAIVARIVVDRGPCRL